MKNILILYPQWPPANLAGVHRARLISNYLPDFDYHPIILTVDENYYEEELDYDFVKTVSSKTEVIKVAANPVKNENRFIGDIALRGFKQLKSKAVELIRSREVDFLWVPIPSYYSAVIARQIHNVTKVSYGIDYIDPWVKPRDAMGKTFSKAWVSNIVAKLLEPYAVKKASLISGVATSYYQPVLDRNFKNKEIKHVGMPYGFDPNDHCINLPNVKLPWDETKEEVFLYAGALLPKSILFLKALFKAVKKLKDNGQWQSTQKMYFIGTRSNKENSVSSHAESFGLGDVVVEIPERRPFLHILYFLGKAKGVLVLGSTEQHYTASKIFQSVLSERPIFPIFHHKSSVIHILESCNASKFLVKYKEGQDDLQLDSDILESFFAFVTTKDWAVNLKALEKYSAKSSAKALVKGISQTITSD